MVIFSRRKTEKEVILYAENGNRIAFQKPKLTKLAGKWKWGRKRSGKEKWQKRKHET